MARMTDEQWQDAGLTGWVRLATGIHTRVETGRFTTGAELLAAITQVAEKANHHPDVTLRYPTLDVMLISHDVGEVTDRDVSMAQQIEQLVAERGLSLNPNAVMQVELGLDTTDGPQLAPFWHAILGYADDDRTDEVLDLDTSGPTIWFQGTDAHDEPRQRWHPDIWVSASEAKRRTEAAIEAGGRLVDDSEAPSFVVLADPDGNRVCLCTADSRG